MPAPANHVIALSVSSKTWQQLGRFVRLFAIAAIGPLITLQASGLLTLDHTGLVAAEGVLVGALEATWRGLHPIAAAPAPEAPVAP